MIWSAGSIGRSLFLSEALTPSGPGDSFKLYKACLAAGRQFYADGFPAGARKENVWGPTIFINDREVPENPLDS